MIINESGIKNESVEELYSKYEILNSWQNDNKKNTMKKMNESGVELIKIISQTFINYSKCNDSINEMAKLCNFMIRKCVWGTDKSFNIYNLKEIKDNKRKKQKKLYD